jgi:uncharacterized protein involved in oxidation of intracellular sulfur
MSALFILNDPPYGTERSYNALRLAKALHKSDPGADIALFLMADAVSCAKAGQKTPPGFYNLEVMIKGVARHAKIVLCGACMDARGLADGELVEGAVRGTMAELAQLTLDADKVLVF